MFRNQWVKDQWPKKIGKAINRQSTREKMMMAGAFENMYNLVTV